MYEKRWAVDIRKARIAHLHDNFFVFIETTAINAHLSHSAIRSSKSGSVANFLFEAIWGMISLCDPQ